MSADSQRPGNGIAAMPTDGFRIYEPHELAKDGYPPQWHRDAQGELGIKDVVRWYADDRCVRCGHPYVLGGEWTPCDENCEHAGPRRYRLTRENGDICPDWVLSDGTQPAVPTNARDVEAQWRILTVHHLNGRKHDCRWWNLTPLCQRCHLTIQGKVKMERVYPLEHSDWFKLYAAGWYAYAYLDEDLTPEQTADRMDELLALEQVVA